MDAYAVKKKGGSWYISENKSIVANTFDYQAAKYVYYGPLLHRTLKTVTQLLAKVRYARLKKEERTVIDATIEEVKILIRLVENAKEENFGIQS